MERGEVGKVRLDGEKPETAPLRKETMMQECNRRSTKGERWETGRVQAHTRA